MTPHESHLRDLYQALSAGANGADLARFFHPDAEQVEFPSLMRPAGHRRALDAILAGAEVGARMIREQHFDVLGLLEVGDEVAVQLTWTATVAVDVGALAAGTRLTAHVAAFYVFRDGLVLQQSSYDCYEPLAA